MTVSTLLDPIRERIQHGFVRRAAPDDEFVWEIGLTPTMNGSDCEEHAGLEIMAVFYASLGCPESGTRSTASLVLPLDLLHDLEEVEQWVDDLWDKMVLNRMVASTSFDEAGFDPGA